MTGEDIDPITLEALRQLARARGEDWLTFITRMQEIAEAEGRTLDELALEWVSPMPFGRPDDG